MPLTLMQQVILLHALHLLATMKSQDHIPHKIMRDRVPSGMIMVITFCGVPLYLELVVCGGVDQRKENLMFFLPL